MSELYIRLIRFTVVMVAFVIAAASPLIVKADISSDLTSAQVMQVLERSHSLKGEISSEVKAIYKGHEDDMVGLDDAMNSFEVNELVAEIMETEASQ